MLKTLLEVHLQRQCQTEVAAQVRVGKSQDEVQEQKKGPHMRLDG